MLQLVFINNDDETEMMMQKNFSCWSRAAEPVVVGDLSRHDAMTFLTNGVFMENVNGDSSDPTAHRMHAELASSIYDVVGGRLLHLITFKRNFFAGISFTETLQHLRNHEREKFVNVSRKPSLWKIVSELREAPEKTLKLSKVVKMMSEEDVRALLRMRVVKVERNGAGALLKFFSPLTEYVVDEMERKYAIERMERLQHLQEERRAHAVLGIHTVVKLAASVVLAAACLMFAPK